MITTLPITSDESAFLDALMRELHQGNPWDAFQPRWIYGMAVRHAQTGRSGIVTSRRVHWVPALGYVVSVRWDDAPGRIRRCGTTHLSLV